MIHLSFRKSLLCCSIALNGLCAGGMFTFPLISPLLASHCKLAQPQLTTIVLAGMMSQYTIAALVGWVIDKHGPALCSLVAALVFSTGFGGFALEIYNTPGDLSESVHGAFYRFTFFFFLVGLGTVFGYFSSLFAASKAFPGHLGLASGTSMAFFGLSPLFISVIATSFFTDSNTGVLDVTSFMSFLALLTGIVYMVGFIFLQQVPRMVDSIESSPSPDMRPHGENTPLLFESREGGGRAADPTVSELLKQSDFWILAIYCVIILGISEMVISNIGTILVSLPLPSDGSTTRETLLDSSAAFQVKLISASNTLARISVGPLADFVSPIAAYLPSGIQAFPRKHRISRFAFLSASGMLLALTFLWTVLAVQDRGQVWVLSLGTGLSYSAVFTILPSLVSSLWGMKNMGRNFGIMMYAPFTGTPLFSYLYAFISARHAKADAGICVGKPCWQSTFYFAIAGSTIASMTTFALWRRWKGKI